MHPINTLYCQPVNTPPIPASLKLAAERHPLESREMDELFEKVEGAIKACMLRLVDHSHHATTTTHLYRHILIR